MTRIPMILLSRRPREIGVDWSDARSWLGGAPRLGRAVWPRDETGKPMHFLAQIDFAEIAATVGPTPLPDEGSLAFFVGGKGAALFVPNSRGAPPTPPPSDTTDLTNCGAAGEWPFDPAGRALFPFWPVDFTRLDIEPPAGLDADDAFEAVYAAQNAAIGRHFRRREYSLSADEVFSGPAIPDWWRCAIFVSEKLAEAVKNAPKVLADAEQMLAYTLGKLEEARQASAEALKASQADAPGPLDRLRVVFGRRSTPAAPNEETRLAAQNLKKAQESVKLYENKIARLHRLLPALKEFAAEVADWTSGRDPWSLMDADDRARLGGYFTRLTEFPEYTVHYGVMPLDYLKKQMFDKLPGSDNPAFAALPADVRQVIAGRRAPHPQWWRTVIRFAEAMRESLARQKPYALIEKREKLAAAGPEKVEELAALNAKEAAFRAFAAEVWSWTQARDPLQPMSEAEIAELARRLARFQELREIASAYYVKHLQDFEGATLVSLATAEDAAYATLPDHARVLINEQYLLPTGISHQMFGQPVFIQGDAIAQAEEGELLLLQLGFDDMMFWDFGDNGAYTFWISPEDLARRNWDGVTVIFECH